MQILLEFDHQWTFYLQSLSHVSDWVYFPFTLVGSVWFFFFLSLVQIFYSFRKGIPLSWQLLHPFLSLVLFMALTEALKIAIGRVRPDFLIDNPGQYFLPFCFQVGCHSFPSSHAAVLTFIGSYRQKPIWYLLAIITGLSRIFLKRHFLLDVLFGLLWGYLLGKTLKVSAQKIANSTYIIYWMARLNQLSSILSK